MEKVFFFLYAIFYLFGKNLRKLQTKIFKIHSKRKEKKKEKKINPKVFQKHTSNNVAVIPFFRFPFKAVTRIRKCSASFQNSFSSFSFSIHIRVGLSFDVSPTALVRLKLKRKSNGCRFFLEIRAESFNGRGRAKYNPHKSLQTKL